MAKFKRSEYWESLRSSPEPRWAKPTVLITVETVDQSGSYLVMLTRVPCVGEELSIEADTFRVTRVIHEPLDVDGRPRLGFAAILDVERVPESAEPRPRRKRSRLKTSSKRRRPRDGANPRTGLQPVVNPG